MMIYRHMTTALQSKELLNISTAAFISPPILATKERPRKRSMATAITIAAATSLLNIALRLIQRPNSKAVVTEIHSRPSKRQGWRSLSLQEEEGLLDWTLCATKNGSNCARRRKSVVSVQQRDIRHTIVRSSDRMTAMEALRISLAPC